MESYVWEYNHDCPHHGLGDGTPREALLGSDSELGIEALSL